MGYQKLIYMGQTPRPVGALYSELPAARQSWKLHAVVGGVSVGAKTCGLTSVASAKRALIVPICRTRTGNAIRGCTYLGYERAIERMPAIGPEQTFIISGRDAIRISHK